MKTKISYSLLAAAMACGVAFGQTAYTTPVGYYNFDGKQGGNLFVPGFVNSAVFAGQTTAASATTLTVATGALTANAFNQGAVYPTHYVEITQAGSNQGVVINIASNTSNVITLASDITALALTGTETITVRPHVTLAGVFSSAEAGLAAFGDSATFFESNGDAVSYFYQESGYWTSDFENPNGSNRPIPPGTGFVFDIPGADKPLTIVGEVKSSPVVVQFNGGGAPNVIGALNPLVGNQSQLASLGFVSMTAFSDSMTLFAPGNLVSPLGTYFSDGANVTFDFETAADAPLGFTTGGIFQAPGASSSIRVQSGL